MATLTWKSAQTGNWSATTFWAPNAVPGAAGGDIAMINATGTNYTITYNEAAETLNDLTINSAGATLAFNATDALTVNGATALQAGTINLLNSGAVLNAGNLTTSSGSTINLGSGATLNYYGATVGGVVDITGTTSFGATGASLTLDGLVEATGGTGAVNFAQISGTGTLEANGGTLLVTGVLANSTVLAAISNSAASVFETTGPLFWGSSVSIKFLGALGEFEYNNSGSDTHVIFNTAGLNAGSSKMVPTNFMDLGGEAITIRSGGAGLGATGTVLLSNNDTLNLSGITGFGPLGWAAEAVSDGHGGTEIFLASVCYAAGTRILTATGERMVESLMRGDIVLTLAGEELIAQPVKWIGRRRIDLTAHPQPETVAPIRIRRGAFAEAMPHNDVLLSPDHAVFVDGKLICARQLVNGTTIRRETGWTAVEYYHVELDAHAILLAEGLPAESYLNTGNRGFFANSGEPLVLHPDLTDETDYPARAAGSCAPFVSDEASVRPVWQRLAERAAALGQPAPKLDTTNDPGLRIVAKGRTLRPLYGENGLYIFALPKGATEVRVVSRAGLPTDARPWLDDRRCLGVNVERIVLRGANELREVPVDHPDLSQGWHEVERDGLALRRWTSGDAVLPLPVLSGPTMLEIRAGGGGMAYLADADQMQRAA